LLATTENVVVAVMFADAWLLGPVCVRPPPLHAKFVGALPPVQLTARFTVPPPTGSDEVLGVIAQPLGATTVGADETQVTAVVAAGPGPRRSSPSPNMTRVRYRPA
jgi:hypothetical protein